MKLWQRYLFCRLISSFLFFFFCLFALYIAIDFSMLGAKLLSRDTACIFDIAFNYLRQFAKFLDLFFSLSFLLASLQVLLNLKIHRELLALQIAGISSKKLLAPFFFLAIFLLAASYINSQWFAPDIKKASSDFYKMHVKKKQSKQESIFSSVLKDGSELVYQNYHLKHKKLFDVFWIRSANDFWHMKTLCFASSPPIAQFADHFTRNETKAFEKVSSSTEYIFIEIPLENEDFLHCFIPFENRSLETLFKQTLGRCAESRKSSAHLHYKLALPFFPILILLAISPAIFHFSKNGSLFLIIACALFAFIGFKTLIDSMLILAENQVFSAPMAIWTPILFVGAFHLYFFLRMR